MAIARDLNENWRKWNEFARGKSVVAVECDEYAVYNNAVNFSSHRDFITYLFKQRGYYVTQFGHKYTANGEVEKWGLVFERADSEIRTLILVKGIIGVNIRPIMEASL